MMLAWVRSCARSESGCRSTDAGMTLVELLVGMVLMSIVLSLLALAFNGDLKTTKVVNNRVNSTADARLAMEAITRHLRVGVTPAGMSNPFVSGKTTGTSVSFYSSWVTAREAAPAATATVPTRYTYALDPARNNCLAEWVTPAVVSGTSTTWPFTDGSRHCIANGVVTVAFSYYDTGTSISTISDLTLVDSVGVTLTVAASSSDTYPITLTDRVTLPNLGSTS